MKSTLLASIALCAAASLPAQTTIFVSTSGSDATGTGTQANPYRTIAFANGLALQGDTIRVGPGTFDETQQITMGGQSITLRGSGAGVTVIRPPATGTTLLAGFLPGTPTNHVAGVVINGPATINVSNLTIDGANRMPSSQRLVGLWVGGGGDAIVDNVEIIGAREAPLAGSQRPAGVFVRGDDIDDPCNVFLQECTIRDFGKAGVAAFFNSHVRMEYSEVRGAGITSAVAQVGVQIGYGATGELRHNIIGDLSYGPSTFASSGVLLFDAGSGSQIFDNDIARCDDGLAVYNSAFGAVPALIQNNRITASYGRALRLQNVSGVSVVNNRLHGTDVGQFPTYDNAPLGSNTWSRNNYADFNGLGSYIIDGGINKDVTPRNGVEEVNGPGTSVALGVVLTDVAAGDLDGINQLDFAAVGNSPGGPVLIIGTENGAGGFSSSSSFLPGASTAVNAQKVLTGNFNGDANTDIAVLTKSNPPAVNQEKLWIFAGDGAGNFAPLSVTIVTGSVGNADVASADLDGDGSLDFVVAFRNSSFANGGATVLLNDGNGSSFTQSALPGVSGPCGAVAIGDVVSGNNDVVVAAGSASFGTTYVVAGDGAGNFALSTQFASSDAPNGAGLIDADADGDLDILVAGVTDRNVFIPGTLVVAYNNGGSFSTRELPIDRNPTNLIVADLDNDDDPDTVRPDAVVLNEGGRSISVLGAFENGAPTRGGIALVRSGFGTSVPPRAGDVADMNGDGLNDLLIASESSVYTSLGVPSSRVDLFGFPCPGERGRTPLISTLGTPPLAQVGNTSFGIRLSNGRPLTGAALMFGVAPDTNLVPCSFNVAPVPLVLALATLTNAAGSAQFNISVPNDPSLLGGDTLTTQWLLLDPSGGFLGAASLTKGMRVRIGAF